MSKTNMTAAEMREELAKTKTEIAQTENSLNQMIRQTNKLTRKARTSRLIQRGALLESMIKEADTLTNEQIKKLLQTAFNSASVREMAVAFRAENAAAAANGDGIMRRTQRNRRQFRLNSAEHNEAAEK